MTIKSKIRVMRDNWSITLIQYVQLVPYQRKFVEKYHQWMTDPQILELTASEPLSIEEEYSMQALWRTDPYKCTFIVLRGGSGSELERMIGDVNLFLHDADDRTNAEIEIMIAESACRRKGCGRDALLLMMGYGIRNLGITRFFAKINASNYQSISLFTSLGYLEVNFVAAFQEYEFEYRCNMDNCQKIFDNTAQSREEHYISEE